VVEGVGDHGCEYMTGGAVVVLGGTGRNFAAGMSGGVAYVFDEHADFEHRCNTAMVELEAIPDQPAPWGGGNGEAMAQLMADPTRHDAARLKVLIERHLHYTNSARARAILAHWKDALPKFVKIMPTDYRRALKELQAQPVAHAPAPRSDLRAEAAHG
jgi:glutamate synthase (NADPH/NADH) large chain